MTYSVVSRACNKVLIGETYWTSVVVPSLMFGAPVVAWNQGELEELQRVENRVWRCVLGAPGYAAVAALRGEVGASSTKGRAMKAKLMYVRSTMEKENSALARIVLEDMYRKGTGKWIKVIKKYLESIGIERLELICNGTDVQLRAKIDEIDKRNWRNKASTKTTLRLYNQFKKEPKKEKIYDNTFESSLLFRARCDSLDLGWRKTYQNQDVHCKLCGAEVETLEHFLLKCKDLGSIRVEFGMEDKLLEWVLIFNGDCNVSITKRYLSAIWGRLKARLKEMGSL